MNPISSTLIHGTLGELLVQARLLQFGVQASPPLKDSGNDLIAIRGNEFRSIQVKTTTKDSYTIPNHSTIYHILAAVKIIALENDIQFDKCEIFLIPFCQVLNLPRQFSKIQKYKISQQLIDDLFNKKNIKNNKT